MINKKIRLIELFAGVGTQALALRDLCKANGVNPDNVFETYRVIEFDKYPVKSYNAIHGTDIEPMDITTIHGEDLDVKEPDKYTAIWTYSFPCFTGDTLVLTSSGYKEIKNVCIGDEVLSHDNKYHKVVASSKTGEKPIWTIQGMGFDEIKCTENHKFYVRKMIKHMPVGENGRRYRTREFLSPEWKECKDLDKSYYLGMAINQNSILPEWDGITFTWNNGRKDQHKNQLSDLLNNHSFWWIVGRYVGDGWSRSQGGIIICCNKKEVNEITPHLRNCGFNYNVVDDKTSAKIHIVLKELDKFLKQFGHGAGEKTLPGFMFDLPINYIRSFIDGYISADGFSLDTYHFGATSISKKLIYSIGQLVAKAYNRPFAIYKNMVPNKKEIDGREINQKDFYQIKWKSNNSKQDKAFYEDGYIWFPISSISNVGAIEEVFDITVDDSHSFIANGVIVHNCQDLSVAGKGAGMDKGSGTRSGLLWEVERLLGEVENLPDVLIMENVTQVHGKKNFDNFNKWCEFLESKGYHNHWEDLNSKDYCIPQNRNRTFMVSTLEDIKYEFPKPVELRFVMKDMLDETVPEKYYINTEKADQLIQELAESGKLDELKGSL